VPTTITAPAPVQQGYDQKPYPQGIVGGPVPTITGTCTTSGGVVNVRITAPVSGMPDVTIQLTATTTTWTTGALLTFIPQAPGRYRIDATDVAAAQVATQYYDVYSSPGI